MIDQTTQELRNVYAEVVRWFRASDRDPYRAGYRLGIKHAISWAIRDQKTLRQTERVEALIERKWQRENPWFSEMPYKRKRSRAGRPQRPLRRSGSRAK